MISRRSSARRLNPAELLSFKYFQRGQPSRSRHDSAAGVRAGTAHVEILNRSAVFCPTGHRTKEKKLIQSQFALKNISFRKAKFLLQVPRGNDLTVKDDVFQIGCIFTQRIDDRIA